LATRAAEVSADLSSVDAYFRRLAVLDARVDRDRAVADGAVVEPDDEAPSILNL
jgi:hypothetical protein